MNPEMKLETDDFKLGYEPGNNTVFFKGSFRLPGVPNYAPVTKFLNEVAAQKPSKLMLDLRELEFLNSSGINAFSRYVLSMRQRGEVQLGIHGTNRIAWQSKSLSNFQKLMPSLQLIMDD